MQFRNQQAPVIMIEQRNQVVDKVNDQELDVGRFLLGRPKKLDPIHGQLKRGLD